MNNYEGIFIVKPDLKEDEVKNAFKSIADSIVKNNGKVEKEEIWGKKVLAYPVKKFREGHYLKLDFNADPSAITKLENTYKLNPDLLRIMITRK